MPVCPPVCRSFSDECGPGIFHTLGVLLKRPRSPCRSPVFHIAHDDEHTSFNKHSPLPSASFSTVHFPGLDSNSQQSSGTPSSSSTPCPTPPCSQLAMGTSAPILLSNGKPLRPSLKSSSPTILIPSNTHVRACSEPSTPKNVHFPETDYGLATVRVFSCFARPAALGNPASANDDETETEGEDAPTTRFQFPYLSQVFNYEIDPTKSSPVPSKSPPVNLFLESIKLSSSFSSSTATTKPLLIGSILVCNLAFEKHVTIRFTLDDWQTVSEVGAHYVGSLSALSSKPLPSQFPGDMQGRGWDRFLFTIRLGDHAPSLSTRILWLAARYRIDSTYQEPGCSQCGPGGEWWDNNGGGNYRIAFRPASAGPASPRSKPRRETVSGPIPSPRTQPQLQMTCKEYALGLMIPSAPIKEERRSTSLRTGKLNLCNYVPPTVLATSSISFPSAGSHKTSSSPSITTAVLPSLSDEDSASSASSTLSTPTLSPTIVPRVTIGGQPTTHTCRSSEKDDDETIAYSKPGYIADWDWSSGSKRRVESPSCQHVDIVPGSEPPKQPDDIPSPPGINDLSDSNSLYDAFVTQWCFAGPSSRHHCHDGDRGLT